MKRSVLMGCAGLAIAGSAMAQNVVQPSVVPAGMGVKRVYVNMQTGERRTTEATPRIGGQVWGNDDGGGDGSGFYAPFWGPGGYGWNDTEIWDSGQLASDCTIDGIQIWYQAEGQSAASTVPILFAISDDYSLCDATYPTLTSGVFLDEFASADPSFSFLVTYDLAGFEFGLAGDGTDFGFGIFIDQANASEPLAGPAGLTIVNENLASAPGTQDAFEGLDVGAIGEGCWFFGGAPYAQFHLVLYGTVGGPCPSADFNGDGFTDFFDYDDYVPCFEGTCPPGLDADFNGDGFTDFFDYDDFVFAFEGCP